MNSNSFRELDNETQTKVNEFRLYLKGQIVKSQMLELDDADLNVKKSVLHQTMIFANLLIEYFKTLYCDEINTDNPSDFNTQALSQAAFIKFLSLLDNTPPSDDSIISDNKEDIKLDHKYDDYFFIKYLNIDDVSELVDLLKTTKNFIPPPDLSSSDKPPASNTSSNSPFTPPSNKQKDNTSKPSATEKLITTKAAQTLHMIIPILTSRVFFKYSLRLRKDLASAAIAARIKNTSTSKLSKDISNLIEKEKSIDAPLMKDIISKSVPKEVDKV